MKFCSNCGKQIDENAIFCPNCGARTNGDESADRGGFNPYGSYNPYGGNPYGGTYPVYDTTPSKLVSVIAFLSWQIGLILWFLWRRTRPGKAESAIKGALASACVSMPILGLALWLLWKKEPSKVSLAKIAGISAIVGVGVYVLYFGLEILLSLSGIGDVALPMGDMMAHLTTFLG